MAIVAFAYAIIKPSAMMVETIHTPIAGSAMFGIRLYIRFANFAKELVISCVKRRPKTINYIFVLPSFLAGFIKRQSGIGRVTWGCDECEIYHCWEDQTVCQSQKWAYDFIVGEGDYHNEVKSIGVQKNYHIRYDLERMERPVPAISINSSLDNIRSYRC